MCLRRIELPLSYNAHSRGRARRAKQLICIRDQPFKQGMIIIYIYVGSSDFSREVLTFMKISSDFSREVLKFMKISSQKHWVYDTWSAGGLYFARVFF